MDAVSLASRASWWRGSSVVLNLLLGLLLAVSMSCERNVEDLNDIEISTYLQAESLARDLDLAYEEADRDRLERRFGPSDRDLLLSERDSSGVRFFAHPRVYTLVLAPFVRLAGLRGPAIVNSLLLLFAALVAARQLRKSLGSDAPMLVALLIFASVTYRSVFLFQPHVFLLTVVVFAVGLAVRFDEPGVHDLQEVYRPRPGALRIASNWFGIGLLIGIATVYHPVYALLLFPMILLTPAGNKKAGSLALAAGAVLTLLLDLPEIGSLLPSEIDVGLSAWNLLYLVVGRNVGVLIYFLPLVLVLGLVRGGEGRSSLWLTALVGSIVFVTLVPFDIYDGPAAVGNGWLLPLTGLLWFVPTRPLPHQWIWIAALFAAPLMYPTWMAPNLDLVTPESTYRHASGWLSQWLPPETTQRPIPNGGEVKGQGLWVRSLDAAARPTSGGRWLMEGDQQVQLLLASPAPIGSVFLQFGPQAEPDLELKGGGSLGNMVLAPEGGITFQVEDLKRRALHPMWWSSEKQHVYFLRMKMPQQEPKIQSLTIRAFGLEFGGGEQ